MRGGSAGVVREFKDCSDDDLVFSKFQKDFLIDGKHVKYGLWNNSGDWWYAFDNLEELKKQVRENLLTRCECDK